jgi:hypothetical protein
MYAIVYYIEMLKMLKKIARRKIQKSFIPITSKNSASGLKIGGDLHGRDRTQGIVQNVHTVIPSNVEKYVGQRTQKTQFSCQNPGNLIETQLQRIFPPRK